MSQVSLPVTRSSGRALLVGNAALRGRLRETLDRLGYGCDEAEDPYAGMADLCRRPLAYHSVILSLAGLYREELTIIRAMKQRFGHVEVWLAHTDGRQAALAEAVRLGADGLLDEEGLHRVALSGALHDEPTQQRSPADLAAGFDSSTRPEPPEPDGDIQSGEPLLSADELRALLQEQPAVPPAGDEPA